MEENEGASTLTGISQAVLNGNGLRSNEFVQESIEKGYYITAMKYRYEHRMDMTEFAVVLSFKNKDLRVDIDKTYYEDDGKIYVQPLIKSEQDEIIVEFQDVAYRVFNEIIYIFLTIFLYLLKCPQSLILSALRAFCFCGKPHISRSIFLYFRYQAWLKSW